MEQYAARYRNGYGNETDLDLGSGMAAQHRKDNNDLDDNNNLAQFDCICRAHLAAGMQAASAWQAEIHAYLKEVEADVSLPNIDVVKWWQVCTILIFFYSITYNCEFKDHTHLYPLLAHITLNVLAIPASSVPCEHLFSVGKQTADHCHTRLGTEKFEQLQVMKFSWHSKIADYASINSATVHEVHNLLCKYEDFLSHDRMEAQLDTCWTTKTNLFKL